MVGTCGNVISERETLAVWGDWIDVSVVPTERVWMSCCHVLTGAGEDLAYYDGKNWCARDTGRIVAEVRAWRVLLKRPARGGVRLRGRLFFDEVENASAA